MATLVTGWAALPLLRDADRLLISGRTAERNALLLTINPAYWNGRQIIEVAA